MASWPLRPNRSDSVSFPFAPSKTYFFSIFSHGNSRRRRLSSSRIRVNSFSFVRNCLRAASHSAGVTAFVEDFSIVAVVIVVTPFPSNRFSHLSSYEELLRPARSIHRLKPRCPPPLLHSLNMPDTYFLLNHCNRFLTSCHVQRATGFPSASAPSLHSFRACDRQE